MLCFRPHPCRIGNCVSRSNRVPCWAERSRLRQQPQSRRFLVPGQVAKAGRITDLHPAPPSVAELRKAL